MTITVGIGALTITDVVNVARHDTPIILDPAALAEVAKTRQHIEELATEPTPVYGVSTGFGALARRHIPQELRTQLQRSLVRSHAAGSGPEVERDVIRALMLLRLSTLMTGRTGVRPVVVETYAALLNAGITPIVYEYGSLGCSGDLAPLAHCALALMGEGDVRLADGTKTPAADALAAALAAATEAHGPIEVLVASAGINRESLAARTSSQMWDEVISADLTGTFNTVRAVTPAMMRARKGRIVLVSSAIAARGGVGLSAYGAAKGGVEGLTRSLARELAPRGITVNAVAPGFVTTAMTASLPDHIRTAYLEQIPLGRFADVADIAGPVLFLASPAAAYVTGAILGVDGGLGMGR